MFWKLKRLPPVLYFYLIYNYSSSSYSLFTMAFATIILYMLSIVYYIDSINNNCKKIGEVAWNGVGMEKSGAYATAEVKRW